MPRAKPALSLATLPLSAGVGPPRCADGNHHHHPATPGKAQGLTWYYCTLPATTPHTANALRTHGPKGRSGGAAGDCRPDHNLGGSTTFYLPPPVNIPE